MKFGINDTTRDAIRSIFRSFSQIEKVIIFGSRAKGNHKEGSDIDLTLIGKNMDLSMLSRLDYLLDNLNLPYSFDIVIFDYIDNSDLIEHIQKVGIVFYERDMQV